jgi:hypothetical protein
VAAAGLALEAAGIEPSAVDGVGRRLGVGYLVGEWPQADVVRVAWEGADTERAEEESRESPERTGGPGGSRQFPEERKGHVRDGSTKPYAISPGRPGRPEYPEHPDGPGVPVGPVSLPRPEDPGAPASPGNGSVGTSHAEGAAAVTRALDRCARALEEAGWQVSLHRPRTAAPPFLLASPRRL